MNPKNITYALLISISLLHIQNAYSKNKPTWEYDDTDINRPIAFIPKNYPYDSKVIITDPPLIEGKEKKRFNNIKKSILNNITGDLVLKKRAKNYGKLIYFYSHLENNDYYNDNESNEQEYVTGKKLFSSIIDAELIERLYGGKYATCFANDAAEVICFAPSPLQE